MLSYLAAAAAVLLILAAIGLCGLNAGQRSAVMFGARRVRWGLLALLMAGFAALATAGAFGLLPA